MSGHIGRSFDRTELAEPMIAEGQRESSAILVSTSKKK